MHESKSLQAAQRVAHALATLTPDDGVLFVVAGERFARVRRCDDGGYRVELPSNEILPPERWIDAAGVDALRAAGFALPKGAELFFARTFDLEPGEERSLAQEIARLLGEAGGGAPEDALATFASRASCERPSSARFADELRAYRAAPDPGAWDRLCAALLDAELALAVEPALDASASSLRLRALQSSDGSSAAAAFTGMEPLRLAAPRGLPHAIVRGAEAVLCAAAQGFDALVIDPRGPLPVQLRGEIFVRLLESARAARASGA